MFEGEHTWGKGGELAEKGSEREGRLIGARERGGGEGKGAPRGEGKSGRVGTAVEKGEGPCVRRWRENDESLNEGTCLDD